MKWSRGQWLLCLSPGHWAHGDVLSAVGDIYSVTSTCGIACLRASSAWLEWNSYRSSTCNRSGLWSWCSSPSLHRDVPEMAMWMYKPPRYRAEVVLLCQGTGVLCVWCSVLWCTLLTGAGSSSAFALCLVFWSSFSCLFCHCSCTYSAPLLFSPLYLDALDFPGTHSSPYGHHAARCASQWPWDLCCCSTVKSGLILEPHLPAQAHFGFDLVSLILFFSLKLHGFLVRITYPRPEQELKVSVGFDLCRASPILVKILRI